MEMKNERRQDSELAAKTQRLVVVLFGNIIVII